LTDFAGLASLLLNRVTARKIPSVHHSKFFREDIIHVMYSATDPAWLGCVMKAAVGEGTAEALVEEQKQ
jgi:hypothetical protein